MRKRRATCLALYVGLLVHTSDGAQAAPTLFSYDANYTVQLSRGSSSTGPRAMNGVLETRFQEVCDGWTTRTRIVLDLTFRDGTMLTNQRDFDSFESKDGRTYTFAARTVKGGVPVEAFRGKVQTRMRSGRTVIYEIPSDKDGESKTRTLSVSLPRNTLLPVQHAVAILERAEKGDRQFRSVLFNGASPVGPRLMSTIIGPQVVPVLSDAPSAIDQTLLNVPAWDLNVAFFNLIENRETPAFEVFQRFYASGIAPSFEQEFGDFNIRADLDRLQRLKPEACPNK